MYPSSAFTHKTEYTNTEHCTEAVKELTEKLD